MKVPYASIITAIAGLILSYMESAYLVNNYNQGVGIKPSSFLFSAAMVSVAFSRKGERAYSHFPEWVRISFEFIGKNSFAIYLIHCYLITCISPAFTAHALSWGVRWGVVLSSTILLIEFLKRLFPSRITFLLGIYD